MRLILARCVLIGLLSASVAASAEPSGRSADELARPQSSPSPTGAATLDLAAQHFQTGVEFYRATQYEQSRVEFEAAYGLSKLPDLLHNLSLVSERQGRIADAISFEERFLAEKSKELQMDEVDQSRGRLLRLREQLKAQGSAPSTQAATVPTGGTERRAAPKGAVALVGSGSVLLAIGIGCGAGALVTAKTVSEGGPFYLNDYQALLDRGQGLERGAISLGVIGGAAVVAGGAWWIYRRTRAR
jgi:hypothetical protein